MRYSERSASALWRWQRNRELSIVGKLLGEVSGLNVLDLGCGAGFYTRYCVDQKACEVTAVDFAPRMIEQLPEDRVVGKISDAAEFTTDKSFAKIICAGLLEFVAAPESILVNARRLVAPGGSMVCLVPPDNLAGRLYRAYHLRNGISVALFSRASFAQLVDNAGWMLDAHVFIFPYTSVYRLKTDNAK